MQFYFLKNKQKGLAPLETCPALSISGQRPSVERGSTKAQQSACADKFQAGFSLVEMLVALVSITVIIGGVGLAFVGMLNLQRRGFGAQKVQENSSFMLEMIAREARASSFDNQDSGCTATSISLNHPVNGTVVYAYNASEKKVTRSEDGGVAVDITSGEVEVNRLNFCVFGSIPGDDQEARIGIVMQMQNKSLNPANVVVFDLQTTLTSRDTLAEF